MTEYTCIVCPLSCQLTLTDSQGELSVTGNSCKRGEEYAKNEHTNPKRMVTTTVKLSGARLKCLPVISTGPIPKVLLRPALQELYKLQAAAPVTLGQVILPNILDTGVDIVAARTVS